MTREIGFRLVDVFAPRPLEGNQLCVVSEPGDLEHDRMLDVAREIAFSETTFVTATRPDGYDVRIFTPDEEIPFAGHPTLGTAYVLASDRRIGPTATQVSAAGGVPVEVDVASSFAWMTQMPPVFASPSTIASSSRGRAGCAPPTSTRTYRPRSSRRGSRR